MSLRVIEFLSFLCCLCCPIYPAQTRLIQNDWETLANETIIRYFNPAKFSPSEDADEIWDQMGEDITCTVDGSTGEVTLEGPPSLNTEKPWKILTHGFSSEATGEKTAFVNAWMSTSDNGYNVVLLDWSPLATFAGADSWTNFAYDLAARNAIDVGEYFGLCLSGLSKRYGVKGDSIHLTGHSLGAHLMGKAGRTFRTAQDNIDVINRITGLDPAGPRFVDGPSLEAIPELRDNILTPESASFVDVIHTNGDLEPCVFCQSPHFGALLQLGHIDFFPSGGSGQPGCVTGIDIGVSCSHSRSVKYFLHSIWEPELFPSQSCSSVEECNSEITNGSDTVAYMGDQVQQPQGRVLRYTEIEDCHWTMYEHNSFLCVWD